MSVRPLPPISVIKKEDKESRLTAFISDHLFTAGTDGCEISPCQEILLVARSGESPVVRALAATLGGPDRPAPHIRAILTMPRDAAQEPLPAALSVLAEARFVTDPRILDAHEQLWLGPRTAWIGDCMRREPAKRDAYECYAQDCAATAQSTAVAFERLWAMAKPANTAVERANQPDEQIAAHIAGAANTEPAPPTAATRH